MRWRGGRSTTPVGGRITSSVDCVLVVDACKTGSCDFGVTAHRQVAWRARCATWPASIRGDAATCGARRPRNNHALAASEVASARRTASHGMAQTSLNPFSTSFYTCAKHVHSRLAQEPTKPPSPAQRPDTPAPTTEFPRRHLVTTCLTADRERHTLRHPHPTACIAYAQPD